MSGSIFVIKRTKMAYRRLLKTASAFFCVVFILGSFFFFAVFAAEENALGYSTEVFNVRAVCAENHTIHMTETIRVNFTEGHRGIYRYIPENTKYYQLKNIRCPGYAVKIRKEHHFSGNNLSGTTSVRIGDPDKILTGRHTFRLEYDLICWRDNSRLQDYLSLDLLPTGWETAIASAKMTLLLPRAVKPKQVSVYSGDYGLEKGLSDNIKMNVAKGNREWSFQGTDLKSGEGLTVSAVLPEGYWEDPPSHDSAICLLYIIPFLAGAAAFTLWLLFGRDPKIIRQVEFYPPEGMTPAEAGYIIDGDLSREDVSAMILYYASQGYLRIREESRKKFILEKLKDPEEKEKIFSVTLFNALFAAGDRADLSNMPEEFASSFQVVKEQLLGYYEQPERRVFTRSSQIARGVGWLLSLVPVSAGIFFSAYYQFDDFGMILAAPAGILMLLGVNFTLRVFDRRDSLSRGKRTGYGILAAVFVLGTIIFACSRVMAETEKTLPAIMIIAAEAMTLVFTALMRKRTESNARLTGRLLGFRDFIRRAEYDRLVRLSEEDPEYYFAIMPYAFVLGMSTSWAERFVDIPVKTPSWYSTYRMDSASLFDVYWLSSMMRVSSSEIARGMMPAETDAGASGSGFDIGGGFGGGGFSGGGFGGGGGGAW